MPSVSLLPHGASHAGSGHGWAAWAGGGAGASAGSSCLTRARLAGCGQVRGGTCFWWKWQEINIGVVILMALLQTGGELPAPRSYLRGTVQAGAWQRAGRAAGFAPSVRVSVVPTWIIRTIPGGCGEVGPAQMCVCPPSQGRQPCSSSP